MVKHVILQERVARDSFIVRQRIYSVDAVKINAFYIDQECVKHQKNIYICLRGMEENVRVVQRLCILFIYKSLSSALAQNKICITGSYNIPIITKNPYIYFRIFNVSQNRYIKYHVPPPTACHNPP